MKIKASIVTKSVLVIAIAAGLAACNQNKTADKPAAATPAVTSTPQIVYINQDSLVSQYEYIKDMNKRLEEKGKAAQSEVQSHGQAFQRQYADYQKNAATMPADKRAAMEQQLQRKNQEFQQLQQNASAQVQNEQLTETNALYEKLAAFTKVYAKEKGYKLVLTFQKGNTTVLYGDESIDVTKDVIKRLNDAYAKDKK